MPSCRRQRRGARLREPRHPRHAAAHRVRPAHTRAGRRVLPRLGHPIALPAGELERRDHAAVAQPLQHALHVLERARTPPAAAAVGRLERAREQRLAERGAKPQPLGRRQLVLRDAPRGKRFERKARRVGEVVALAQRPRKRLRVEHERLLRHPPARARRARRARPISPRRRRAQRVQGLGGERRVDPGGRHREAERRVVLDVAPARRPRPKIAAHAVQRVRLLRTTHDGAAHEVVEAAVGEEEERQRGRGEPERGEAGEFHRWRARACSADAATRNLADHSVVSLPPDAAQLSRPRFVAALAIGRRADANPRTMPIATRGSPRRAAARPSAPPPRQARAPKKSTVEGAIKVAEARARRRALPSPHTKNSPRSCRRRATSSRSRRSR